MNKLKIGVVGTGHLGKIHTKLLKTIDECELAGIYDIDEKKKNETAGEFNVNTFNNLDDVINECDAVSIVTTTSTHYEIAKKFLESGVHVFIEKPITAEIWEAVELVKIADENKLTLQVGHIERFNPALLSLEKYNLNPKFIQTDRLAQFNPRGTDVAVVLDLMIHDIDIILSLIKSDVKTISASGVPVVSETIDIANARIEFENGAVANVTASRISQKKMRKMRMFQRDTYISLDFITGTSEVYRLVAPDNYDPLKSISFGEMGIGEKKKLVVYEQPDQKEVNALQHELKLFVNAVVDKTRPVVSGEDGLKALRVAEIIINKIGEQKVN
ncbi:MAG: Gfo/Idh/MocA family oxidoreductase [Melioribacteraceae bacterium]|nr:Gfo/Idh/MocA family oxidoreductase [Melioribacteraceae bacterium]MCF8355634.1 Gfo/Idh/MocA family oxidoreductase [Melioribacteraceae bacterium]MCF8394666.1 Gfo/Idh/MocA family oxidoreductase [Melioribacteraceae bacterium]MCF8418000.1 Gfo/Idh/MocA family oxidoreductase [Melioribacteraceae bacterium]